MHRHGRLFAFLISTLLIGSSVAHGQSDFQPHQCQHQSAEQIAEVLRPLLPVQDDVQLIVNRKNNRLLLSGPPEVQKIAREALRESDRPRSLKRPLPALPSQPGSQESYETSVETKFVAIPPAHFPETQRQIASVFRGQLHPATDEHGSTWNLSLRDDRQPVLNLRFDDRRNGIHVTGPRHLTQQFSKLVTKLAEAPRDGYRTQVFRLRRDNHRSLRGAVKAMGNEKPKPLGAAKPVDQSRYVVPAGSLGTVAQAAFQNPADAGDDGQAEEPNPQLRGLRQFDGVEIESLPDLDVIILRGRDPDLAQLADIVEQLERISKETQPNIRIVPLQHASSEAVAEIIDAGESDLVGGRQGRVSVTPLVKPNALLLIGWGDAVNSVIQLAKQLDTPVAPNTQSAVFRLKYAQADAVGATIEEFLTGRAGLGPRATVTVRPSHQFVDRLRVPAGLARSRETDW